MTVFEGVEYERSSCGEFAIAIKLKNADDSVVIPDTVTIGAVDLPVTVLGTEAFRSSQIEAVSLPVNLKCIQNLCFYDCVKLCQVEFRGQKVTEFGHMVFGGTAMHKMELPVSLKSVGYATFFHCANLVEAVFPPEIVIPAISQGMFEVSGLAKLCVPKSVTGIEDMAFKGSKLSEIVFEDGSHCVRIGNCAFQDTKVTKVVIPIECVQIGTLAFSGSLLTELEFAQPSSCRSIDVMCFCNTPLEYVLLPATLEVIAESSFMNCASLRVVEFEQGSQLNMIGGRAFRGTGLESLSVGNELRVLGSDTFADCENFKVFRTGPGSKLASFPCDAFPCSIEEVYGFGINNIGCTAIHKDSALRKLVLSDLETREARSVVLKHVNLPSKLRISYTEVSLKKRGVSDADREDFALKGI